MQKLMKGEEKNRGILMKEKSSVPGGKKVYGNDLARIVTRVVATTKRWERTIPNELLIGFHGCTG